MATAVAAASRTDLEPTDEEELLLIVSGMGSIVQPASPDEPAGYMVGADCKECIADLQRYLRRDDPMVMAAHRALGSWRVLQTHLIPLLGCIGDSDTKLAFNVLKVVVKLTMKPEQLATRMMDHLKERKTPDPLIGARVDELIRYHRAYKRAYTRGDAMGNLVWLLGKGLSIEENERSEEEAMLIELLLALVLNLLHTSHPDAPPPEAGRAADAISDKETLRALLRCMEREHTLETVLYILQQVEESPTFRNFNLTLLEIVYYALSAQSAEALYTPPPKPPPPKPQTANEAAAQAQAQAAGSIDRGAATAAEGEGAVAEAALEDATAEGEREVAEAAVPTSAQRDGAAAKKAPTPRTAPGSRVHGQAKGVLGSLLASKASHLQSVMASRPSRHGNFGGAFKVNTAFGTQHVAHSLTSSGDAALPNVVKKRASAARRPMSAPLELRRDPKTEVVLKGFVAHLLQGPFNSLMGTVVKDLEGFAFGSNVGNAGKVLIQDHTFFAATASWLLSAHILQQQERRAAADAEGKPAPPFDVGPVGALADATVFILAVRNCRELLEKKAWLPLGVFAGLMRQLFTFLDEMVRFGDAATTAAAATIQRQVFYEQQILELLKGMVVEFEPHKMPPSYLADCVVMTHAVLRQLEGYGGLVLKKRAKKGKKKGKAGAVGPDGNPLEGADTVDAADEDDDDGGAAAQVLEEASLDFDHELYKFAGTREVVTRYVSLLAHFESVPPLAVHCALKMISRLIKQCKLEAMLFQLSILGTLSTILESPIARNQPEHAELYATAKYIVRRFFSVAKTNPALFVEVLVWKRPAECEEISSGYGNRVHQHQRNRELDRGLGLDGGDDGRLLGDGGDDDDAAYVPLEPLEDDEDDEFRAGALGGTPAGAQDETAAEDAPLPAAAPRHDEASASNAVEAAATHGAERGAPAEAKAEDEDSEEEEPAILARDARSKKAKGGKGKHQNPAPKAPRRRAKSWTNEEDERLMGLWSQYGGTADWEHIISGFFGGERSAIEVRNRAKKLNLLRAQARSKAKERQPSELEEEASEEEAQESGDDESGEDDEDDAPPPTKVRRAAPAPPAAAAEESDASEPPSLPPSDDESDEDDAPAAAMPVEPLPKRADAPGAASARKRPADREEVADAPPAKAPAFKRRTVVDSDSDE